MSWQVRVDGPSAVLAELCCQFSKPDLTLGCSDDQFVLKGSAFDNLPDADQVRRKAEQIVKGLSALCRLLLQSTESLTVSGVTEIRPDGSSHVFIQPGPEHVRVSQGLVSTKVTHGDGTVEERRPSDPTPQWLNKSLQDPALIRALSLRDVIDLSWSDLYRLYEVMEFARGGEDKLVASGCVTRVQLRRFKHSANSVKAAGDQARHGVERQAPPADPMSISDARSFVDGLLRSWLNN